MTRIETRDVLAGAYRGRAAKIDATLSHAVSIEGDRERVLCGRVKVESIADAGAGDVDAAPDCPTCLARDPRFNGAK